MKRNVLFLLLLISLGTQAQKITLKKGQQITITTTSTQDVDMSAMGMQMKSSSATTSILDVKDAGNENFVTSFKLFKVNLTMDMMGQQTTYDSEKPEDKDSEIGKAASEKINKEITVLVNKNTGKALLEDKPASASPEKPEEANPLEGLMGSFGAATEDATVETAFFIIPAGKKTGDTWTDSSTKEKMKEVKTYTLKSVDNATATVGLSSVLEGSSSIETQGMQMDVSISSKTTGDILVDPKTFLVKKRINNTDLTGSIEMMGQSIPLTSKAFVTIDYL
jgi:Family of unknown function (DUF6263)